MNYYLTVLKKYAVFKGRAARAEYWFFVLFNFIISIGLGIISALLNDTFNILGMLYALFILIPSIAVSIRRLHDVGKSGWMIFINLIPVVGVIWYLILVVGDSDSGENKYGPNPKHAPTA